VARRCQASHCSFGVLPVPPHTAQSSSSASSNRDRNPALAARSPTPVTPCRLHESLSIHVAWSGPAGAHSLVRAPGPPGSDPHRSSRRFDQLDADADQQARRGERRPAQDDAPEPDAVVERARQDEGDVWRRR
jgi:hypothetical protein